jgi:RNA polymerase primary sigma factor
MPVHMVERERKLGRVERELTMKLHRQPSDEEIAEAAELTLKQLREVQRANRVVVSLDAPSGDHDDVTVADRVASDERAPAEQVELSLRQETLRKAVSTLPPEEREVVELRYGITGEEPKTIEATVRELGMSRDTVRRTEAKALARLARARELAGLKEPV